MTTKPSTRRLTQWIDASATADARKAGVIRRGTGDLLRLVIEAAIWAGRITYTFFEMVTLYPSVRDRLQLPDEERFWLDQPPRDYRATGAGGADGQHPRAALGCRPWAVARPCRCCGSTGLAAGSCTTPTTCWPARASTGRTSSSTSATSWIPGSSFYHIPIRPTAVLGQDDEDRDALRTSTMAVRPMKSGGNGDPIFVSGRQGTARRDALRQMVTALVRAGRRTAPQPG